MKKATKLPRIKDSKTIVQEKFIECCENNNVKYLAHLFTSHIIPDITYKRHLGLIRAASNGSLEVVQFLLTSPILQQHADIHAQNDRAFRMACQNGHFDVVQYLSSSKQLKQHAYTSAKNNEALYVACCNYSIKNFKEKNYSDIIDYLLTSPDLSKKPNIYINDNAIFKEAFKQLTIDSPFLMQKLVFEYDLKYSKIHDDIETVLHYNHRPPTKEELKAVETLNTMLTQRKLVEKLNNDLNKNSNIRVKHKI